MAENDQVVVPQVGVDAIDVPEEEVVTEGTEQIEQDAAQVFTQEQVNQIVSDRINQERQTFDQRLAQYQSQMIARQQAIEQGVARLTGQQAPQRQIDPRAQQLEELLTPALKKITDHIDNRLAPIERQAAMTVEQSFWAQKPKSVPDVVKQNTRALFEHYYQPGQDVQKTLDAAYVTAVGQYQDAMWNGGGVVAPQIATKPAQPAPRIPANQAASGELGRPRAPIGLGGNKQLGWEEQMDEWAKDDVWPGDEDDYAKRRGRR